MVTSSSADSGITAGIDVFSGRPNPNWPVRRADLDALERVWAALERMPVVNAQASVLGYRGCFVQMGDKRWFVSGDVVTLQRPQGSESRRDARGDFERMILATAPADVPVAALTGLDRG